MPWRITEGYDAAAEGRAWQFQRHIYESPFYYIDYGIAQLAAIGIWKNYRSNPKAALDGYVKALEAGYTFTLPELYEMAGISFDFSPQHIQSLASFVQSELKKLD